MENSSLSNAVAYSTDTLLLQILPKNTLRTESALPKSCLGNNFSFKEPGLLLWRQTSQ